MSQKDKAINDLKEMIRKQRASMDPKLLKMAELAVAEAVLKNTVEAHKNATSEPYNKENANKAIEKFLDDHPDAKGFKERLFAFLKKNQH